MIELDSDDEEFLEEADFSSPSSSGSIKEKAAAETLASLMSTRIPSSVGTGSETGLGLIIPLDLGFDLPEDMMVDLPGINGERIQEPLPHLPFMDDSKLSAGVALHPTLPRYPPSDHSLRNKSSTASLRTRVP